MEFAYQCYRFAVGYAINAATEPLANEAVPEEVVSRYPLRRPRRHFERTQRARRHVSAENFNIGGPLSVGRVPVFDVVVAAIIEPGRAGGFVDGRLWGIRDKLNAIPG